MNMMKLGQAGVEVRDCEHKTPLATEVGHPYIAIPDIVDGRVSLENARRISEDNYFEWTKRTTPRVGDIVVTRRGRVGDTAPIPVEGCAVGQNLVILRSDETVILQKYLRWACRSPQWGRGVADFLNVGAVFSSLNVRDIPKISVPVPSKSTQAQTADLLDALDDKIAANRRVIDAGDALIRALYSSTPKASKGRMFAEVADIGGGGTPSTKSPVNWDGDVAWATPTDVTAVDGPWLARTTRSISEEGLKNCSSALYPEGSILMTSRATIGAVVVARKPMAVNQGFIVLNAVESEMQWWLESQVRARTAEFETWANGATFLEISRGTFKKLPVLECSPADLGVFNRTAQAVRERQWSCQAENEKLARTRDELLPLLMSGRITVKDVKRAAEDVL